MWINGRSYIDRAVLDNATVYTSPHVTINGHEYTKHYFMGSERIASNFGSGFGSALTPVSDNQRLISNSEANASTLSEPMVQKLRRDWDCVGMTSEYVEWNTDMSVFGDLNSIDNENTVYFFHPDHLGSTSWILTGSTPIQHLQYLPYGEDYISEQNVNYTFNTNFTFSGKERDVATGYSYFGFRYYDPSTSIWLSVDPMADARSWVTPYNYVQNNPVMRVDPTGALDEPMSSNIGDPKRRARRQQLREARRDSRQHKRLIRNGITDPIIRSNIIAQRKVDRRTGIGVLGDKNSGNYSVSTAKKYADNNPPRPQQPTDDGSNSESGTTGTTTTTNPNQFNLDVIFFGDRAWVTPPFNLRLQDLQRNDIATLQSIANVLNANPGASILITGNVEDGTSRTYDGNANALGLARAQAIADLLSSAFGLNNPNQIQVNSLINVGPGQRTIVIQLFQPGQPVQRIQQTQPITPPRRR